MCVKPSKFYICKCKFSKDLVKRYFIRLAYDGSAFHGWQIQPQSSSVQEKLQEALSTLLSEEISIVGAGRTDTGVHAREMFAHFDTEKEVSANDLTHRLNSFLDSQISIFSIFEVNEDHHARFDATSRTYEYWIIQSKNPFLKKWAFELRKPLDFALMNEASKLIIGKKDFSCFSKSGTQTKTNICNVTHAEWEYRNDHWVFTIKADRFLRNMVRAIAGTLINIGTGMWEMEYLVELIESKDRSLAGSSVPAKGLYLTKVNYNEQIEELFVR